MRFIDVLIPLVAGILLIISPKIFTKSTGEVFERTRQRLKKIGFVLIGVAVLYGFVKVADSFNQAGSGAGKPRMDMHRLQAQTPDGSGWYLAESTYGCFSISIPIPFNDFTVTAEDAKAGLIKSHAVGALSKEGLKFSATEVLRVAGLPSTELENMPKTFAKGGAKVSEVDKTPCLGHRAVSFSVLGQDSGAFFREIELSNRLILVTLEYPLAQREAAAALKARFMDSLKLKQGVNSPPTEQK